MSDTNSMEETEPAHLIRGRASSSKEARQTEVVRNTDRLGDQARSDLIPGKREQKPVGAQSCRGLYNQ